MAINASAPAIAPLAPWDRLPAFDVPIETTYQLSSSATQIAIGDSQRTRLIIGVAGSNLTPPTVTYPIPIAYGIQAATVQLPTIVISTTSLVSMNQGFVISPLGIPFVIDTEGYGLAVTLPWFAVFAGPVAPYVTVLAIRMRHWPEAEDTNGIIADTDRGVYRGRTVGPISRIRRTKLYSDSWRKRAPLSPYDLPY